MEPTAKPSLFEYQKPNDNQIELIVAYRHELQKVYEMILADLPESRERSLAITKLEEASMWLNKAVAFTVR